MVSTIIDSGLRAGFVMGLTVTPSKIQHDGSRWNRKFGRGGSSMVLGSAAFQTSPRSASTSARVIPPMRNSATSAGSASDTQLWARSAAAIPTWRSVRMWEQTQSRAAGPASASASSVSASWTSTPRSRMTSQKASCSRLAWLTQSTSSNSRSSALDGVSRVCSSPGRWTITLRSSPTSEWTPSAMSDLLRCVDAP